jgi:hypothetical protein
MNSWRGETLYYFLDVCLLIPALERLEICVKTTSEKHPLYVLFSVGRLTGYVP